MKGKLDHSEFCQWALGDINSNIKRSWLAEFLVNKALDIHLGQHQQWGDYDIAFGRFKIEVKSSGHLTPPFPSPAFVKNPRFDIERRVAYYCYETEKRLYYPEPRRPADLYVFCLHGAETETGYDPCDISQWLFVSMTTKQIDTKLGDAKSISWSNASSIGIVSTFTNLKATVATQLEDHFPERAL